MTKQHGGPRQELPTVLKLFMFFFFWLVAPLGWFSVYLTTVFAIGGHGRIRWSLLLAAVACSIYILYVQIRYLYILYLEVQYWRMSRSNRCNEAR